MKKGLKILKTCDDFGGYWLKSVKDFKGHEGEPLFQASVYKDNKKIGFFSDDNHGGAAILMGFKEDDRNALCNYAQEYLKTDYPEAYHEFITKIATWCNSWKALSRLKNKNTVFVSNDELNDSEEGLSFRYLKTPFNDDTKQIICKKLDEVIGEDKYIIINHLLDHKPFISGELPDLEESQENEVREEEESLFFP